MARTKTSERLVKVDDKVYHGYKCRHCKFYNGDRNLKGIRCTNPDKVWQSSTSMYKRPNDGACTSFMPPRPDPLIVYIAGPMTGMPQFNRPAFKAAERMLRNIGYRTVNPALLPFDLPDEAYMPICFAMLEQCDAIYLLSGWEQSKGALMEMHHAMELGLKKLETMDLVLLPMEADEYEERLKNEEEGQGAFEYYTVSGEETL